MKFTSSELATITKSTLFGPADLYVSDLVTDSRHVNCAQDMAFIAIHGKNHDGHQYIGTLFQKGIRVFIVSTLPDDHEKYTGASFILANDTLEALQLLAAYKRKLFNSTVIAVTGSAGKTVVKEWLSDVIGRSAAVVRSPKSFNSQVGVPLSVLKLEDKFSYGIFEAGISMPGEMSKLQKIINPDIGIITNVGDAHSENFQDIRAKAVEKLKLFTNASMIIYCSDHQIISEAISNDEKLKSKNLVDWSFTNPAAKYLINREFRLNGPTFLSITHDDVTIDFEIPFSDRASVENAATVAAACLALGIGTDVIRTGLSSLVSVAMRMEVKSGINNCRLIEDYYNSDPGSLVMAIEFLKSQNNRKTTLILSDFLQSGRNEKDLYSDVASLLLKAGIDKFIGIGPALKRNSLLFAEGSEFYYSTEDFIHNFDSHQFSDEIILLKGARAFEFEKIGILLERQVHITVLEINLDAISHNLNEFRRCLKPETKIMAMVKAFAYGSGPAEIARLLEFHRVNYLAVANADEGVEIRNAGVNLPIIVMNPDASAAGLMIKYNLEPEIFSFSSLSKFSEAASKHGLYQYPVHIKIDTGMHRLGFMPEETDTLAHELKDNDCIKVVSVFSHLSGSEDPALDKFSHHQAEVFLKAVSKIEAALGYPFIRHILNTAGIVRFPQYQFEMVRPGIGIYGAGSYDGISLRQVGSFKTKISQIKFIRAGEPVGYGCADVSEEGRSIAILPVGYADGLNRKLGKRNGNVFIRGRRAVLIGNICMDMCMVDITGFNAEEGDEAEIFGPNISIDEVAEKCGTIPYEILTSVPRRVKRIFFRE